MTVAICFVASLALSFRVSADEKVYNKTIQSTVWIVTKTATGTGVLIDEKNRLVVTNEHVVGTNKTVTIFFPVEVNKRRVAESKYYLERRKSLGIVGKVIATNSQRDIAIVQLASIPRGKKAIAIGKPAQPGAEVHSIGNPGNSDALWVYTSGQVRANYYRIFSTSKRRRMQVLETQSPINPGDSGGPIVNNNGELVGISQSFSTKGRLISHGVDISEITWFLDKTRDSNKNLVSNKKSSSSSDNKDTSNNKPTISRRVVEVGGGRKQLVLISNEIDSYQNVKTRKIWSLAKTFSGKIPQSTSLQMLQQNSETKIGGWVLEQSSGNTHAIFLAHANANATDQELQSIVDYVAKVTDAMKKQWK